MEISEAVSILNISLKTNIEDFRKTTRSSFKKLFKLNKFDNEKIFLINKAYDILSKSSDLEIENFCENNQHDYQSDERQKYINNNPKDGNINWFTNNSEFDELLKEAINISDRLRDERSSMQKNKSKNKSKNHFVDESSIVDKNKKLSISNSLSNFYKNEGYLDLYYFERGNYELLNKNNDKAIELFEKSIEENEDFLLPRFLYADLIYEFDKETGFDFYDSADEYMDYLSPIDDHYHFSEALFLSGKGKLRKGEFMLKKAEPYINFSDTYSQIRKLSKYHFENAIKTFDRITNHKECERKRLIKYCRTKISEVDKDTAKAN